MIAVVFYADYGDKQTKRRGGDAPNALAVYVANGFVSCGIEMVECAAALTLAPNAPVCGTFASTEYLREACKRISKAEAYRIHPRLRAYLESAGGGES